MARSLKKGPFVDPSLQRKVDAILRSGSKQVVRTNSFIVKRRGKK